MWLGVNRANLIGDIEKKKTNPEKQYRVKVSDSVQENSTVVAVVDKEGNQVNSSTANRIVALMFEQLK